jgi:hypothetical protein
VSAASSQRLLSIEIRKISEVTPIPSVPNLEMSIFVGVFRPNGLIFN